MDFGIWLSRATDGTIAIEPDEKSPETPMQTGEKSDACFTDYRSK